MNQQHEGFHWPFGVHKGLAMEELPYVYLVWILQEDWLHAHLRERVEAERARRIECTPMPDANSFLWLWGKYEGMRLADVPETALTWAKGRDFILPQVRELIAGEVERRAVRGKPESTQTHAVLWLSPMSQETMH